MMSSSTPARDVEVIGDLRIEPRGAISILEMHRPEKLNAMARTFWGDLRQALQRLQTDGRTRAVIITGAGDRAFSAGGDIASFADLKTQAQKRAFQAEVMETFIAVENANLPIIAAVNGYALGGGCELSLACDIRIASDNARFGQPEITIGILPGFGGSQRLPRLVGKGRALEMILTGEMIDAREALRIGLANRVVPQESLLDEARTMARTIASKGLTAIRLCKEAVVNGLEMELGKGCAYEADLFGQAFATFDQKEGMAAFLEKRPAQFRDC